jgi:hypothetical protein
MHASKRSKLAVDGGAHAATAVTAGAAGTATAAPCGLVVGALSAPSAAVSGAPSAAPAHRFLSHMLMLAAAQITRETGFTHTRKSNMKIIAEVAAKCKAEHRQGLASTAD